MNKRLPADHSLIKLTPADEAKVEANVDALMKQIDFGWLGKAAESFGPALIGVDNETLFKAVRYPTV